MELVAIVIILALIEYIVFGILVGRARARYEVHAPAVSGDPVLERYYRVHQNTLEQLLVFIPAIIIYGHYGNSNFAAIAGLVFIVGRLIYLRGYIADPKQRGTGFFISFLASAFLLIAGLITAAGNLL